jgi:hypothetical protein
MTKKERNNLLILGAVGVGAFYFINKQNQERKQREMIRLQQLQAKQNRGGGLGNLIGSIGDLIQKRRERKAMKGIKVKGNGGFNMPSNIDLSATLGNITGGGNGLDFGGAGTLDKSITDFDVTDFINP